jgi:hypothetical protein
MLAIQHCTPYGIFSLELSVSDGFEEAEISLANAQNRDFFDYLVGTDEDFFLRASSSRSVPKLLPPKGRSNC